MVVTEPVKVSKKVLKNIAKAGAEDITYRHEPLDEPTERVLYSKGQYGLNGALLVGRTTGKFYVITSRSCAIDMFY